MRNAPHPTSDVYREAHHLVDLGYHLVPIEYGTKHPLIKWRDAGCSHALVDDWFARFGSHMNLAIHTGRSGIVGLDADTKQASDWIENHCPRSPMRALTPRGGTHIYFRSPDDAPPPATNLFGIGLDVRSRDSLLLASPSWSQEHGCPWRWDGEVLPPSELPSIHPTLISREPIPLPKSPHRVSGTRRASGPLRDVTRWIMAVPSVQGQAGSNGCFKVCCKLADAGFSYEEAMHWLWLWNERMAQPKWSERELTHKLRDAFNR